MPQTSQKTFLDPSKNISLGEKNFFFSKRIEKDRKSFEKKIENNFEKDFAKFFFSRFFCLRFRQPPTLPLFPDPTFFRSSFIYHIFLIYSYIFIYIHIFYVIFHIYSYIFPIIPMCGAALKGYLHKLFCDKLGATWSQLT